MNFGARLKIIRLSRELSETDLAQAAQIHAATVKRIERRGIRPNLSTVLRLAQALNVTPGVLLGVSK